MEGEWQDLNGDGRPELILRYVVGLHQLTIPWIDVYRLSEGKLTCVNHEYPAFYEELRRHYEKIWPDYESAAQWGWPDALAELEQRMEMAESITGRAP